MNDGAHACGAIIGGTHRLLSFVAIISGISTRALQCKIVSPLNDHIRKSSVLSGGRVGSTNGPWQTITLRALQAANQL
jgi:hypothetical protein